MRIAVGICRSDTDEIGVALRTEPMQVARAGGRRSAKLRQRIPGHGKQPVRIAVRHAPARGNLLGRFGIGGRRAQQRGEPHHGVAVERPRAAGPGARARPAGITWPSTPVSTIRRSAGSGSSAPSSLVISAWMRSPERRRNSGAAAAQAASAHPRRRPAVADEEAEEAQDAQIVLGDARRGVADEAHPARAEIGPAAEIVVEPAGSIAAHGIDREVAARGVGGEVVGELDLGMAAVAGDVAPQRGDLEMPTVRDRAHRAMREPGRDRRQAGALEQPDHLLRALGRGEVDLFDRPPSRPSRTQPPTNRAPRPSASRAARTLRLEARAASLRRERAFGACGHPPGARNDKRVPVAVIVRPQAVVASAPAVSGCLAPFRPQATRSPVRTSFRL